MTKPLTIIKGTPEIKGIPTKLQLYTTRPTEMPFLRDTITLFLERSLNNEHNINAIGSITVTQYDTASWPGHVEARLHIEIKDKAGKIIKLYDEQIYWDAGEEEHMKICCN